jgi:sugar lactone lactonase YvrE
MKTITTAILAAGCMFFSLSAYGHECSSLSTVAAYPIGEVPESITVDKRGNLYFSNGNTVRKRTPSGQESVFATLPIPVFALGVKVGKDDCVYNTSVSLDPTLVGAYVWKTCTEGTIAQVFATLDPTGGPNDLAFDDDGNAFVTDPFLGKVWKVTPQGNASVWLSDPLLEGNTAAPYLLFHSQGVNGIAFDEDKENLYLGNLDYGRILRVPVRRNGTAGSPSVWVSDSRIQGADGIAFDEEGNLFVAVNGQNNLVRISARGRVEVLFSGAPLDSPSSVVFGRRHNDRDTLYVASSAFLRTFGLQTGTPAPAILKTEVRHDGLKLP